MFMKKKVKGRIHRLSVSLHDRGDGQPYKKSVSKGFEMLRPVRLKDILDEAARAIEKRWGQYHD